MPKDLITDTGQDLREELQSGDYAGFFVMTYSIDSDLLEWCFDGEDPLLEEVLLSAPEDRLGELDLAPYEVLDIHTSPDPTHAKIYLLWNNSRIVCWIGSGNFTSDGLSYNVEWSARYSAALTGGTAVSVDTLRTGELPPEPTHDRITNQILDTITARLQGRSADYADDVFARRPPVGILHTELGSTNTLRKAVETIGETADSLDVTYFSPFVNKTGVERFAEVTGVPDDSLRIEVRTAEHERVLDGEGQYLRERHVEALENRFESFDLYRRKSGDDRAILADGTRIRDGFAHFKLILLTAVSDGATAQHAIFTTGNLTGAVWEQPADRFEIGVWLRPSGRAADVHEFGELLHPCYAEPDQEDYETIDTRLDEAEANRGFADRSIGDVLGERLQIDTDTLRFEWPEGYPPLGDLSCTVQTHDVVTAEPDECTVDLRKKGETYSADLSEVPTPPNTIITRINFRITTTLKPPIREIEPGEIESALEADRNIDWDGAILGSGSQRISPEALSEQPDQAVALYHEWVTPHTYPIYHQLTDPPQLCPPLLTDIRSDTSTLPGTNALLPIVRVAPARSIDPPFDTVVFETLNETRIWPLGYTKDGCELRFYFEPTLGGEQLSVGFGTPFKTWDPGRSEIELPTVDNELPDWAEHIGQETWTCEPVLMSGNQSLSTTTDDTIDPRLFITETTPVRVQPPAPSPSLPDNVTRGYGFARRGFSYHRPETNQLSETIRRQPPHATVGYWGEYRLEDGASTITLPTRVERYQVRKQLAETLLPRHTSLTTERRLPWDELEPLTPIGWLVVPNEQLAFEAVPDQLHRYVSLDVYRNGRLLSAETAYVTHDQSGYVIPITKRDCLGGVTISIVARLDSKSPVEDEAQLYAPYLEVVDCSLDSRGGQELAFDFEIRSPQSGRHIQSQYSVVNDPTAATPAFDPSPLSVSSRTLLYEAKHGFLTGIEVTKTDTGVAVLPLNESKVLQLRPSEEMH